MKLFNDMSYSEKLDHIEICQREGMKCITEGYPANLADISDHLDLWGPWMLRELSAILEQRGELSMPDLKI